MSVWICVTFLSHLTPTNSTKSLDSLRFIFFSFKLDNNPFFFHLNKHFTVYLFMLLPLLHIWIQWEHMEAKSAHHITLGLHSGFDYWSKLFMASLVFLGVPWQWSEKQPSGSPMFAQEPPCSFSVLHNDLGPICHPSTIQFVFTLGYMHDQTPPRDLLDEWLLPALELLGLGDLGPGLPLTSCETHLHKPI